MELFNGLEQLGLGDLSGGNLYGNEETEKPAPKKEDTAKKVLLPKEEKDFLFDKSYQCPICTRDFTAKTVRTGKVHTQRIDYDLRPVYDTVDQVKYEVIACPHCGYAVHMMYHGMMTDKQGKMVREAIGEKFRPQEWGKEIYTYDEAKLRYQLALANTIARKGKPSEKAYLCLKSAWLLRGEIEYQESMPQVVEGKIAELAAAEKNYRAQALDGFAQARQTENFPIAKMDEKTLDYLMAALYMDCDKFQESARFIGNILVSKSITTNLRNKTQDLKERLTEKMKDRA